MKKRILMFVIVLCLVIGCFQLTASAVGNYGVNLDSASYTSNNPFYQSGWRGQCTWYAWGRANEKLGVNIACRGNASSWTSGSGFPGGTTPRANSIAVWTYDNVGHVAFVENVDGDTIYITEANIDGVEYTEGYMSASSGGYRNTLGNITYSAVWPSRAKPDYYIYLSGTPAVSVDFAESSRTSINTTGGTLGARLTVSGTTMTQVTQVGVILYDYKGTEIASVRENTNVTQNLNYMDAWYDINSELGYTLSPGTDYKYAFFAVIGGKTYMGAERSFKTSGAHAHSWGNGVLVGTVNTDSGTIATYKYTCTTCGQTKTEDKVYTITDPSQNPFLDVPDDAFYAEAVKWAVRRSITNGTDETHFCPLDGCTRGQVVTFLWRTAGCPEPKRSDTPFTDLKSDGYYVKAVAWAVEKGITKGTSNTTFDPDATCTRGQIVTFLWRFRGEREPRLTKTPFTDLNPTAFYFKAVTWAVENKITNGITNTTFGPEETCTRGQIVTFLYRAIGGR